ncbi:sporulation-delaying protein SdpB family protein [Mucilaginibacter sp.]|uniref:sporulation-delaying protein SdpB family protein n=1 Tax=Mucilaginibacter sp. TaxID=1882438 RepID=UPI002ED3E467
MNEFLFISKLKNPWTNVYGLARSILAMGTALTLLINSPAVLFYNTNTGAAVPVTRTVDVFQWNFFTCFPFSAEITRWLAIVILLVVISGWRPRYTALFHIWVSLSLIQASPFIDGGDQITSVIAILLLPVCLTDSRKWHWKNLDVSSKRLANNPYVVLMCLSVYLVIRVQVAVIYLNAATAKLGVNEWQDGTAVWYWFKDYDFGYNFYVAKIMDPILKTPLLVTSITWFSIFFEFFLFLGLFVEQKYRKWFFISGVFFHFLIIIINGLFSFFFAMFGALILYMRPIDEIFCFASVKAFLVSLVNKKEAKIKPVFKIIDEGSKIPATGGPG